MKTIAIIAAALAGLALAAPTDADAFDGGYAGATLARDAAYGGGYAHQRYYGYPQFNHRYGWYYYFGQPYGAYRWYRYGYHAPPAARVLPVRAVIHALRACDYRHIGHVRLKRGVYHARARDAYGRRVHLEIDAYSGAVIAVHYRY